MKKQPGVMLYFDVRESIAQLSYEEKGMLLDAILDYGQKAQEPDFANRTLGLIWPFVRKDIHRDAQRYRDRQMQAQYAAQKRWHKDAEPMPKDADASETMREVCEPMPKMPSTSTPASPSSPASAAAPTTTAADAQTDSTPPPASSLPRTNGSHLPDIVAQYLPVKKTTPEEAARLKAEALAKLRALPPDAW